MKNIADAERRFIVFVSATATLAAKEYAESDRQSIPFTPSYHSHVASKISGPKQSKIHDKDVTPADSDKQLSCALLHALR